MFTRQFFRNYTKFIHTNPENYLVLKLPTRTAFIYKKNEEPYKIKQFTKCLNFIFNCTDEEQLNLIRKAVDRKLKLHHGVQNYEENLK